MADAKLSSASFAKAPATGPERSLIAQGTTGGDLYRLDNYSATVAPGLTDDENAGYSVGSFWLNKTRGILYQAFSVTAGAAVWRRIRRGHSGYLVGNWYLGEGIGRTFVSGAAKPSTAISLHQVFIPEPITVSDLGFKTGATVAGNTQLAIYRATAAGSRPSTRVGVVASIANAAINTNYSGPLVDGAAYLEPGFYWLASQTDASCTFVSIDVSNNPFPASQLGSTNLAVVVTPLGSISGYDVTNTFNTDPKVTFPTDLTSATLVDHVAGRFPVVGFKVSAVP